MLKEKQSDWKSVAELTAVCRQLDPKDPVKYDYALFGMVLSKKNQPLTFFNTKADSKT